MPTNSTRIWRYSAANGMPGSDPGIYDGPRPATLISESGMYTLVLNHVPFSAIAAARASIATCLYTLSTVATVSPSRAATV